VATPTSNFVPITHLGFGGLNNDQAALIDGAKWGGGYGTGAALTYSFPGATGSAWFVVDYGLNFEFQAGAWFNLNSNEQSAVTQALAVVARSANLSFTQVPDNEGTVGEFRFTSTQNVSPGSLAHAYTPANGVIESGDVWFSPDWNESGGIITKGSHDFLTILHEIGHGLGLKHPFESGNSGAVLSDEYDNYLYTIMSYSSKAGVANSVGADFYPTTFMYLDLVALETLYGRSFIANTGNTSYVFDANQKYWQTITDSGGIDTITYSSAFSGGRIDLSNATFSQMGLAVNFYNGTSTRDTIALGPSTVIENATGGGGADTLIGNGVANRLVGGGGADTLKGAAGADNLNGGTGTDKLFGDTGNDILVWSAGDTHNGGTGIDTLKLPGSLNLTTTPNARTAGIERIDMTGGGNATLTVNASDVLALSTTSNTLTILGNAGDTVNLMGPFARQSNVGNFEVWKYGSALVQIELELNVV
jgi:Ca2+-binding RTX toxin-like protein